MSRVVLYFGTFNPIHNGHYALCDYMTSGSLCDEVWFVVSPQSPFKSGGHLDSGEHRLAMARLAVEQWGLSAQVSDIEFDMAMPSYTIDTLERLRDLYPENTFSILMGEDNLYTLDKWREWERILMSTHIYIYPRSIDSSGESIDFKIGQLSECSGVDSGNFTTLDDAMKVDISSTDIRLAVSRGDSINSSTAGNVVEYINRNKLYE